MKNFNTLLLASMIASPLAAAAVTTGAPSNALTSAQVQQVQQVVHDYLLNNPQILIEVSQKLQAQQQQQAQQIQSDAAKTFPAIMPQLLNDNNSPVAGNMQGDVALIEFFDYQCPHCKEMSGTVVDLIKQNPNLKVIYKEFPIYGDSSNFAASAALAAMQQGKYTAFHDALMQASDPLSNDKVMQVAQSVGIDTTQLQTAMKASTIAQELKNNVNLAQKLKLLGTPAFIIVNVKNPSQAILIPGTTGEDVLQGLIDQAKAGKLS